LGVLEDEKIGWENQKKKKEGYGLENQSSKVSREENMVIIRNPKLSRVEVFHGSSRGEEGGGL